MQLTVYYRGKKKSSDFDQRALQPGYVESMAAQILKELVLEEEDQSLSDDKYPLHAAVLKCDKDRVAELLQRGVPATSFDERGQTPLHWAVFGGYYEIAELLLRNGADVNAIAEDGVTPLWRAEDFGLADVATLLRSNGGKSISRKPRPPLGLKPR